MGLRDVARPADYRRIARRLEMAGLGAVADDMGGIVAGHGAGKALGRAFPLGHWVFKLAPYSRALERLASRMVRAVGAEQKQISINLGDQMSCVALKK